MASEPVAEAAQKELEREKVGHWTSQLQLASAVIENAFPSESSDNLSEVRDTLVSSETVRWRHPQAHKFCRDEGVGQVLGR